jgi:hypothetical protein
VNHNSSAHLIDHGASSIRCSSLRRKGSPCRSFWLQGYRGIWKDHWDCILRLAWWLRIWLQPGHVRSGLDHEFLHQSSEFISLEHVVLVYLLRLSQTNGYAEGTGLAQGLLTSILELGAWVGTLINGYLADAVGRRYCALIACVVFTVGVIVQACTVNKDYVLAGRFVTGLGVGSLSMVVPLYNAELSPPEIRGSLVAVQQLAITFGIMISFWIGYGKSIAKTRYYDQSLIHARNEFYRRHW